METYSATELHRQMGDIPVDSLQVAIDLDYEPTVEMIGQLPGGIIVIPGLSPETAVSIASGDTASRVLLAYRLAEMCDPRPPVDLSDLADREWTSPDGRCDAYQYGDESIVFDDDDGYKTAPDLPTMLEYTRWDAQTFAGWEGSEWESDRVRIDRAAGEMGLAMWVGGAGVTYYTPAEDGEEESDGIPVRYDADGMVVSVDHEHWGTRQAVHRGVLDTTEMVVDLLQDYA